MYRLIFINILSVIICLTLSGTNIRTTGFIHSADREKYSVFFSESYHNYLPGSLIRIGVNFKNNTSDNLKVSQKLSIADSKGVIVWKTRINMNLLPNGIVIVPLLIPVPVSSGIFTLIPGEAVEGENSKQLGFSFTVIQPKKSARLSKILVHTPDWEDGLNKFLKTWDIKAPTISWGQVLLLGKKSMTKYFAGDREIIQLISRSLKREMSVIFLDFGQTDTPNINIPKMSLPYNISVNFTEAKAPEQCIILKSDSPEFIFGFTSNIINAWNGLSGVVVPATDLRFDGNGVKINAYVTTGENPFRFPLVELIPKNGKGKVYLSQLITDGRLDESVRTPRNHPELPAYDPLAVQFLLNLISASVGDNLLK